MRKQKSVAQKLFEKFLMCERNSQFGVAVVKDKNRQTCVVLGIGDVNGDGFTPLATLLTKKDIDSMEPDLLWSAAINDLYAKARECTDAKKLADFDGVGNLGLFSAECIDEIEAVITDAKKELDI